MAAACAPATPISARCRRTRKSMPASRANFCRPDDPKPMTVRFDVVNIFDTIYQIRSGTGIGVFAPQYGPRRGYFAGVSKKF